MSVVAVMIGIALALGGAFSVASPDRVLSITNWESNRGLYIAAAIRIVIGGVLLLAAPDSRVPAAFEVLGAIVLFAGLGLLFVPEPRWQALIAWVREHREFYRIAAFVSVLLGVLIAYAAWP